MPTKRTLAAVTAVLLGGGGLWVGAAVAGASTHASRPAVLNGRSAQVTTSTTGPTRQAPSTAATASQDTDNVQQGDQNAPDQGGSTARVEDGKSADETEHGNSEEPGDQSLPGGGHADQAGQNVDHQFEGRE
jgi:hypothetical protein